MVGSSTGGGTLASAAYHTAAGPVTAQFRRLRPGCILSREGGLYGAVMSLPSLLQSARALYSCSAVDAALVCSVHSPARVYLLWPAKQPPPAHIQANWILVRGAEVKVSCCSMLLSPAAAEIMTASPHPVCCQRYCWHVWFNMYNLC
jgi:hypothetical protein